MSTSFFEAGTIDGQIDVEVTYQIIGLFSEGLYSSPYKALEELVSNSFDADASIVHVVVPADLADRSASIAVIDNGVGMDAEGLRLHWIVGDSIKRRNRGTAAGRRTIGKFGIGKLAAYVLGDRPHSHQVRRLAVLLHDDGLHRHPADRQRRPARGGEGPPIRAQLHQRRRRRRRVFDYRYEAVRSNLRTLRCWPS